MKCEWGEFKASISRNSSHRESFCQLLGILQNVSNHGAMLPFSLSEVRRKIELFSETTALSTKKSLVVDVVQAVVPLVLADSGSPSTASGFSVPHEHTKADSTKAIVDLITLITSMVLEPGNMATAEQLLFALGVPPVYCSQVGAVLCMSTAVEVHEFVPAVQSFFDSVLRGAAVAASSSGTETTDRSEGDGSDSTAAGSSPAQKWAVFHRLLRNTDREAYMMLLATLQKAKHDAQTHGEVRSALLF
jgi:hypothetical protein